MPEGGRPCNTSLSRSRAMLQKDARFKPAIDRSMPSKRRKERSAVTDGQQKFRFEAFVSASESQEGADGYCL
jgi:hypothetical protein